MHGAAAAGHPRVSMGYLELGSVRVTPTTAISHAPDISSRTLAFPQNRPALGSWAERCVQGAAGAAQCCARLIAGARAYEVEAKPEQVGSRWPNIPSSHCQRLGSGDVCAPVPL